MKLLTTLAILYLLTGCTVIETVWRFLPESEEKYYQDCNKASLADFYECSQYNYQLKKEREQ